MRGSRNLLLNYSLIVRVQFFFLLIIFSLNVNCGQDIQSSMQDLEASLNSVSTKLEELVYILQVCKKLKKGDCFETQYDFSKFLNLIQINNPSAGKSMELKYNDFSAEELLIEYEQLVKDYYDELLKFEVRFVIILALYADECGARGELEFSQMLARANRSVFWEEVPDYNKALKLFWEEYQNTPFPNDDSCKNDLDALLKLAVLLREKLIAVKDGRQRLTSSWIFIYEAKYSEYAANLFLGSEK